MKMTTNRQSVEQGQYSSIANQWTKIPSIFLSIYGIFTVFKNCIYLFHDFLKKPDGKTLHKR
jgi:hypothetical protein